MENIYTHNVTLEETRILDKMTPGRRIDEKIIYDNLSDIDLIFADLFRLYSIRGDKQKPGGRARFQMPHLLLPALVILAVIRDPQRRQA